MKKRNLLLLLAAAGGAYLALKKKKEAEAPLGTASETPMTEPITPLGGEALERKAAPADAPA